MKFGVCTDVKNAQILKNIGYDYLELSLNNIAELSEGKYQVLKDEVFKSPLKPYAFNCLLPGKIKVTGEGVNKTKVISYLKVALNRASELGGTIVVFGSGNSRRVPEGFNMERAFQQLIEFLKIASSIAEENGIIIVIEPLRRAETNIINTAAEGLRLAKEINHPNIRLLVDFYHMTLENENSDILLKANREYIKHIHIANPKGRLWPKDIEEVEYVNFFNNLRAINYDGGISIEGNTSEITVDAPISMKFFKRIKM